MAHFLLADDEPGIRKNFRRLLESQGHTCEEAGDRFEVADAVDHSENEAFNPFDLILMDFHFGDGTTGLTIMSDLGKAYCEHRVVVLTAMKDFSLPSEFARLGAIGHLLKPVSEDQFWVTIRAALTRREAFIEQKEDWEAAVETLERAGVLEGIDQYDTVNRQLADQLESLKAINEQLQAELRQAGQREEEIAKAYEKAGEALGTLPGDINMICPALQQFSFTRPLLSDIETLFSKDRLHFYSLAAYLTRIGAHQDYPYRVLSGRASGHAEYRVGRSYRLYFRRAADGVILERFGNKTVQDKITDYLSNSNDEVFVSDRDDLFPVKQLANS